MAKSLVIVESPAKAKTIGKYLGSDYAVEASVGHIMDLPKNDIGVEIANRTFEPTLIVSPGKEKVVERLKKLAAKADFVYLAPDPDREGEAIAAHLAIQLLPMMKDKSKLRRVTFNEITQKAVKAAFEHARDVDENLVDAQQTRRVLDRLVGYQVSPLLWDKVRRGLSAGRVQTVALRLIVEREREIKAFEKKEYWTIDANLAGPKPPAFDARFVGKGEEKIEVTNGEDAEKIRAALENADWAVRTVDRKERRRNATPPFTTSKLQQDSSRKLRFSVKRTMMIAQRLYEGVELGEEGQVGLITYMRTDSVRLSPDAVEAVRGLIRTRYGAEMLPDEPVIFKGRKSAQDAHEAIRPTSLGYPPEKVRPFLEPDMARLYELIWNRFVACQMKPAVYEQTTADISAGRAGFRATGSTLKFAGWLSIYGEVPAEEEPEKPLAGEEASEVTTGALPPLAEGDLLSLRQLLPEQHFTQPPPRFTEASLVKELEEQGIGRPSTYAAILSVIQDKQYVEKRENRFY